MAGGMRGIMGTVSLILIAGALVLMFFVVLSGVKDSTPLNKTYFLRTDTSSITGARPISQWTYFYVCGDGNTDCGSPVPDLPFGYAWVGGGSGAPSDFLGGHGKDTTSKYYFFLWRFGWVFYLMGLVSTVVAFFTALLAPCSRLASGFSGVVLMFALFFYTMGVSLMTAEFVKAHDAFNRAGLTSKIGRYAFGFSWGAWAAIFLATIFLFLGCGAGGRSDDKVRSSRRTNGATGGGLGNVGFFRRQRSRRSARGSFVDNESQRRVKDEYA
ncbi:putative SUR7 family protein FMP45 [Mollisia scopiformis]|uniref:Putative SUR7 family protein FMP45 n=1 Tax=Mollisia scopiformis TaxID=149040 RepID=A0A194X1U3_MOLSC|nr:putative SUR7 family protein FMP45 [Mollisia scopiformis]KUJ13949.1 putative SUR7 family protein FMP45 [Mollisia scopiformis]